MEDETKDGITSPEETFRNNIIEAHEQMIVFKAEMVYNKRAYNVVRKNDVDLLSRKAGVLFEYIRYMIVEKGLHKRPGNKEIRHEYVNLLKNIRALKINVDQLFFACEYLAECVHDLGITNLLFDRRD